MVSLSLFFFLNSFFKSVQMNTQLIFVSVYFHFFIFVFVLVRFEWLNSIENNLWIENSEYSLFHEKRHNLVRIIWSRKFIFFFCFCFNSLFCFQFRLQSTIRRKKRKKNKFLFVFQTWQIKNKNKSYTTTNRKANKDNE